MQTQHFHSGCRQPGRMHQLLLYGHHQNVLVFHLVPPAGNSYSSNFDIQFQCDSYIFRWTDQDRIHQRHSRIRSDRQDSSRQHCRESHRQFSQPRNRLPRFQQIVYRGNFQLFHFNTQHSTLIIFSLIIIIKRSTTGNCLRNISATKWHLTEDTSTTQSATFPSREGAAHPTTLQMWTFE